MSIHMVNLGQRKAVLECGQIVPITMKDNTGDDTDNPEDAVSVTAGPDLEGAYYIDTLDTFSTATLH